MRLDRVRWTERLRLEPMGPDDADDLVALHADPDVAKWSWTEAEARSVATEAGEAWADGGVHKWMAYDRETDELVGRGGLSRIIHEGHPFLEVGWALFGARWGRGYATEIGQEALRMAFEEMGEPLVIAFTEAHNVRSRAVMERLGMRFVRTFVGEGLVEGSDEVQEDATFVVYSVRRDGTG